MHHEEQSDPARVLLLGRQGSGKGLIGRLLAAKIGAGFLSMGDILRAERQRDDERAKLIRSLIDAGRGVPPDVSYGLMQAVLDAHPTNRPLILDGVPRKADETHRVRALLGHEPTLVITLEVPTPIAMQRLRDRVTCQACGWPHGPGWPAQDGSCRNCRGELAARPDDSFAGIARRLEVWRGEARPIMAYYEQLGVLRTIAADAGVDVVVERALDALARSNGEA